MGATETPAEWFERWSALFPWMKDLAVHIATNPGVLDQLSPDQQAIIQQAGGKTAVVNAAIEYNRKGNFSKKLIWIIPSAIVLAGIIYVLSKPAKK